MRYPMWENIFKKPTEDSQTVLALKGVPIFQDLEKKELREIEHLIHQRTYAKGETVFSQGQPGLGIYIILSGSIDIIQSDKDDNQLKLATLEEGAFLGEMGLLVDAPRSASARANEVTRMTAFFRPDFLDLLHRQPTIGTKILRGLAEVMASRLREQNNLSQELQQQVLDLQQQLKLEQEKQIDHGVVQSSQEN